MNKEYIKLLPTGLIYFSCLYFTEALVCKSYARNARYLRTRTTLTLWRRWPVHRGRVDPGEWPLRVSREQSPGHGRVQGLRDDQLRRAAAANRTVGALATVHIVHLDVLLLVAVRVTARWLLLLRGQQRLNTERYFRFNARLGNRRLLRRHFVYIVTCCVWWKFRYSNNCEDITRIY